MASLGNALVSKILGHSEAEKAFRPWWDNVEDFLVYGLVMLGLIVAPTAIINGTPLDCTICQKHNCKFLNLSERLEQKDPQFNIFWVKKYCTVTAVDDFILYFPYILLIMAMVMVLIERGFVRLFKAGLKLDTFYELLVRERELPSGKDPENDPVPDHPLKKQYVSENRYLKSAVQISNSFSSSDNYYLSYVVRTVIEAVVASALLVWLCGFGLPIIYNDEFIKCEVYDHLYECAGHPQEFYMYVLLVAIVILIVYLVCSFYNILWLAIPGMGTMSRVMTRYKKRMRKVNKDLSKVSDRALLGELSSMYYKNSDMRLLLDLLAASSGVGVSLRILTLFDKMFRLKMEPRDVKLTKAHIHSRPNDWAKCNPEEALEDNSCPPDEGLYDLVVEFNEPVASKEIFCHVNSTPCFYTVEIDPPTCKSSVKLIEPKVNRILSSKNGSFGTNPDLSFMEMGPLEGGKAKGDASSSPVLHARIILYNLESCRDYALTVCTLMGGKILGSRTVKVKAEGPD